MNDYLGPYQLGPNDDEHCGIYTGDARVLAEAIPDESVDLIFTDPVYQNIDDYRWLTWLGGRVGKLQSNWLAFTNAKWLGLLLREVPTDLPPLAYQRASVVCPLNGHVIAKTHYLVWWGSGVIHGYVPDGYLSVNWTANGKDPGGHRWTKNPKYIKKILAAFTHGDDIILDPFTGGGTVPAVCKMLGRRYLAFEIDPATAERARERVRNTQPPLFVPEPEQTAMDMSA